MRIYTTPDLQIRLIKKDGSIATDLEFEYLVFTLKNFRTQIDKRVEASEVEGGIFTITLTQEETGAFPPGEIDAEINFWNGNKRLGTLIKKVRIENNLIDEVR